MSETRIQDEAIDAEVMEPAPVELKPEAAIEDEQQDDKAKITALLLSNVWRRVAESESLYCEYGIERGVTCHAAAIITVTNETINGLHGIHRNPKLKNGAGQMSAGWMKRPWALCWKHAAEGRLDLNAAD